MSYVCRHVLKKENWCYFMKDFIIKRIIFRDLDY